MTPLQPKLFPAVIPAEPERALEAFHHPYAYAAARESAIESPPPASARSGRRRALARGCFVAE
jgi:hypothetical protein